MTVFFFLRHPGLEPGPRSRGYDSLSARTRLLLGSGSMAGMTVGAVLTSMGVRE